MARLEVAVLLTSGTLEPHQEDAVRDLLAATADPTDDELEKEALALSDTLRYELLENSPKLATMFCVGYTSGARREGAK